MEEIKEIRRKYWERFRKFEKEFENTGYVISSFNESRDLYVIVTQEFYDSYDDARFKLIRRKYNTKEVEKFLKDIKEVHYIVKYHSNFSEKIFEGTFKNAIDHPELREGYEVELEYVSSFYDLLNLHYFGDDGIYEEVEKEEYEKARDIY